MTLTSDLIEALRREWRAELRTHRAQLGGRIASVRQDLGELREDEAAHHTEATRAFAHIGDELAAIRATLEPLAAKHLRRARRRALARRVITSTPGVIAAIAGTAGAVAGLLALL